MIRLELCEGRAMIQLPTQTNTPDYHWSPTNQRAFLEHLAIIGSVTLAAKHVGMSARAAYDLKYRRDGAAFKLGWAAAVLIARGRLGDDLLERAIHGYDEEYVRTPADENGEVRIRRRRIDSRLGMEYLKRLDRMADGVAENAGELQVAQVIMGDWEAFLDRLAPSDGDGSGVAAVACWLAGRDNRFNPLSGLWEKSDDDREVAQISEGFQAEPDEETDPVETAAAMSVWFCDEVCEWRTDFPPPLDYDGDEHGRFGDWDYERSLTDEEERIQTVLQEAALKPLHDVAREARERWFGGEAAAVVQAEMAAEAALIEEALGRRRAKQERAAIEATAVAEAITGEPVEAELAETTHSPSAYDFSAAYQPDDPNVSGIYG